VKLRVTVDWVNPKSGARLVACCHRYAVHHLFHHARRSGSGFRHDRPDVGGAVFSGVLPEGLAPVETALIALALGRSLSAGSVSSPSSGRTPVSLGTTSAPAAAWMVSSGWFSKPLAQFCSLAAYECDRSRRRVGPLSVDPLIGWLKIPSAMRTAQAACRIRATQPRPMPRGRPPRPRLRDAHPVCRWECPSTPRVQATWIRARG
jgi:hypothetical protein